eukprot:4372886-Pleurochrysis_carterae.AAC.1
MAGRSELKDEFSEQSSHDHLRSKQAKENLNFHTLSQAKFLAFGSSASMEGGPHMWGERESVVTSMTNVRMSALLK